MKKDYLISTVSFFSFLALWQAISSFGISTEIISSPLDIVTKIFLLFIDGTISKHVLYSVYLITTSFISCTLGGILIGLLLYRYPALFNIARPFLFSANSLPVLAISPLIIMIFGFESISKIFIMMIASLPIMIISTFYGAKNTDKNLLKMAKSFDKSSFEILKGIVFFSALPNIFSGMRIMIGRCIIGLVIADMFGYGIGLGYLLNLFNNTGDSAGLFAIILLLLSLNFFFNGIINILKKSVSKRFHYHFD